MRCCGHHGATGLARTGEQEVVELEFRKLYTNLPGFIEKRKLLSWKVGWYFFDQELCQVAGVFRHFDHRPIARRERIDKAGEAEIDRKIPGHDRAHNAQRLRQYPVASTEKVA